MIRDFIKRRFGLFSFIVLLSIIGMSTAAGASILLAYAFNEVISGHFNLFLRWVLLFLLLNVVSDLAETLFGIVGEKMIQKYNHFLRASYVKAICNGEEKNKDINYHINTLTNDLVLLSQNYLWGFLKMVNAVFKILFAIVALFTFHWSLVVAAVILASLMILVPMMFNKQLIAVTKNISAANQALISTLNDWLSGIFELRWNGALNKLWATIDPRAKLLEADYVKNENLNSWVGFCSNAIGTISQLSLILLASFLATKGLVPVGLVVSVGDFVFQIFTGLVTMSNNITSHISGRPIKDKYQTMLTAVPVSQPLLEQETTILAPITVNVVGLGYQYANKKINYPDFKIAAGNKVAIVGPSGVGKTTLIEILSGELRDYTGTVQINQTELRKISERSLQKNIGVIPQHSHLFKTSVAENILLFNESLASKLPNVLRKVNLLSTVDELAAGVDTIVDPTMETLSGGEQQRISLARAFIRDKQFLIMDEGTSALDEANARDIVARLLNQPDITLLMVTHTSDHQLLAQFDQIIDLGDFSAAL